MLATVLSAPHPSTPFSSSSSSSSASSSSSLHDVAVKYPDLTASSKDDNCSNTASIVLPVQTSALKQFQDEVLLLTGLQHPNIVGLVGVSHGLNDSGAFSPAILLEFVSGGDLYHGIHDPFGLSKAIQIAERVVLTIGKFYSGQALFQTSPMTYSAPDPLPSFEEIEGVAQISRIYEKAITSTPACYHSSISELNSELSDALRRFYPGPLTNQLHKAVQTTFDSLLVRSVSLRDLMMPLSWEIRLKVSADICAGMAYLHSLSPSILHRDLKSPNVLLTQSLNTISSVDWGRPLAKVADFGLSLRLFGNSELKVAKNHQSMAYITPTWCAPEVLAHLAYSGSSDVYSFGILLYEMLTQRHPFSDLIADAVKGAVIQGVRPTIPESLFDSCPAFLDLIQKCWHPNPQERPDFPEVYKLLRVIVSLRLKIELPPLQLEETNTKVSLKPSTPLYRSTPTITRIERLITSTRTLSAQKMLPEATLTWRQRRAAAAAVDVSPIVLERQQPLTQTEHKVSFLMPIDQDSFAIGYNNGVVGIAQLSHDSASSEITECQPELAHRQGVSAMCMNSQSHIWSGSLDGSLSVWIGNSVDLNHGLEHCYVRGWVQGWVAARFGSLTERPRWAVLENGIIRWFEDPQAGPDVESFSLCTPGIHAEFDKEKGAILLQHNSSKIKFTVGNREGPDEMGSFARWYSAISLLIQLYTFGRANLRLAHYVNPSSAAAAATSSSREAPASQIISLESIDQAVWSVSSNFSITEWELSSVGDEHGLHRTHRIQPLRSVSVNMSAFEPRFQSLQGILRAAPSVIWVIGANCISTIDTSEGAPRVDWQPLHRRKHSDYIRCRALVRNHTLLSSLEAQANSALNFEVWTCDNAGTICIWQSQWDSDDAAASDSTPSTQPTLLAQSDTNLAGTNILCLAQVNPTQVWGGTSNGTIIGWDIATRTQLKSDPLPSSSPLRHQRPVIQIFPTHNPLQLVTHNNKVISGSRDQLILFHLGYESTSEHE